MGHIHEPYPQFSVECFKEFLRIVRGNTIREELALFVKCLWTLISGGLAATIGEPPGPAPTFGHEGVDCTTDELQECLTALQGMKEDGPGIYGAGETAIDPAILAILIDLGIKAIMAWLAKRNA